MRCFIAAEVALDRRRRLVIAFPTVRAIVVDVIIVVVVVRSAALAWG